MRKERPDRVINSRMVRCESFRNFVMCLHGLDILSTWALFFSLLCATASAFQYSHLAKDLEVFVTNCMNNPRSCSARVDEMRVFGNCLYSLCRPCFLVSLVHCRRIQQLCLFPFWSARKHTWKYVLLSTLLHDQSRLQSFPCFQHQFVWLPFSRILVCKGGQLFVLSCTWEHEIRVFEPELRCCVTLA